MSPEFQLEQLTASAYTIPTDLPEAAVPHKEFDQHLVTPAFIPISNIRGLQRQLVRIAKAKG